MSPRPRPIEERFWSKVDKSGECWIWTASKMHKGYGNFTIDNKTNRAHRVSFQMAYGPIDPSIWLDHLCHNPACVRPTHLRKVTPKQNNENKLRSTTSASGIKGVYQEPDGKWRGRVTHHGEIFSTRRFVTAEECETAVIALRLELFTHNEDDKRRSS